MTNRILRDGALAWRRELVDFISHRRADRPPRSTLRPIEDEQRRITGGVLIHFFKFLRETVTDELYPQLVEHPLAQRLFLFVTDEGGLQAAATLMDGESEQALALLKEEWRLFLEDPRFDDDDAFVHHYQFWSVWHRKIPENWDVPALEPGFTYWIHEEGYALADGVGRGAQHLWRWDGEKMTLQEEMMSSWSS